MSKVLVAYIETGTAGGVDRYIINFYKKVKSNNTVDFLTNRLDSRLKTYLESEGSKLIEVPSLKDPMGQYKAIKELVSKEKYDTVYFNISTALMILGPAAARAGGAKRVIIHSHSTGLDVTNKLKRSIEYALHGMLKFFMYKFATDFYACSTEAAYWMFPKHVIKSKRFRLVNNAVDAERFEFDSSKREAVRKSLSVADKDFLIMQMGNMVYQKNYPFTIKLFNEFLKTHENAKLLIVGSGEIEHEIRNQVKKFGISNSVIFAGQVNNPQDYLSASDIYIMPSNFEGLSVAAVEAQANGIPCLFSDKMSRETNVIGNCEFLPICGEGAVEVWVESLNKYYKIKAENKIYRREDAIKKIISADYSLKHQNLSELLN